MNAFDFLITVALGASFGRILTARNVALAEAVTAFGLLVVLQLAAAVLRQRSQRAERLLTVSPTLLFYRGNFQRAEMRKERVTEDELTGAIRQIGLGSFGNVEAILLEANGKLSVVSAAQAGTQVRCPAALAEVSALRADLSGRGSLGSGKRDNRWRGRTAARIPVGALDRPHRAAGSLAAPQRDLWQRAALTWCRRRWLPLA